MAIAEHSESPGHGGAAHPSGRTYVLVGVILAAITLVELWVYAQESLSGVLVPVLLVLSALKFILVVGFYMHLKFDSPWFLYMFGFGLLVAGSIMTALLFLQPPGAPLAPPHALWISGLT